jgi:hypothetical protein
MGNLQASRTVKKAKVDPKAALATKNVKYVLKGAVHGTEITEPAKVMGEAVLHPVSALRGRRALLARRRPPPGAA